MPDETSEALRARIAELEARLEKAREAQDTLEAIRSGQVESLVIEGPNGPCIFSLEGTNYSYRVLVEAISEGALTMGEDGLVLYCNARFAQMVRAPLEQVMGNPLRQWIDERWRPSLEALLRHAADAHGRGELCLCASDGLEVRVHLSASAIHDDGRQVYCLVATELGAPWHAEKLVGAGPAPMEIAEESQVRTLAVVTDQFEKEYVLRVLAIAKGKRGRCAELLGISRRGLWLRLRKFGITGSGAKA